MWKVSESGDDSIFAHCDLVKIIYKKANRILHSNTAMQADLLKTAMQADLLKKQKNHKKSHFMIFGADYI